MEHTISLLGSRSGENRQTSHVFRTSCWLASALMTHLPSAPTPPSAKMPNVAPGPASIHLQRPCFHSLSPVRSEITPFSVAHSAPAPSRLDSVSLPPIMTALPRSAAAAVSALPAAARGPRLSVACRNPVSAASLRGSCRIHVLLHAAVAVMMASAAFSVAHAQGWSKAQLSQARFALSATSVGKVAIFAGGVSHCNGKLLQIAFVCCVRECWLRL
jgi:hypothetical protein